jgi:hypothetical protein
MMSGYTAPTTVDAIPSAPARSMTVDDLFGDD